MADDRALLKDDLVDDRALESLDDDRFSHRDFVGELAQLVSVVPTPANIALFAPWGSGKSSLRNLLKLTLMTRSEKAREDEAKVAFAKFDSFKFGEAPLRRHFISQVADEFGVEGERYKEDLYRTTETQKFQFSHKELTRLVWLFLGTLAVLALTVFIGASLVAVVVAAIGQKNLGHTWSKAVNDSKDVAFGAVVLSALLTPFLQLVQQRLTITSTRGSVSGEEEFEQLFKDLVNEALNHNKADRLVIFIDELDRCSSEEVVSTLETIKTFLEVKGCVFVVAADLQVLEQALRKHARQETPRDVTNPYYSAGSSYLDKIFQYQVSLPPLKPHRLSRYALDLVQKKGGLWGRIPNLDEAVSVLIPTHITSPRRVKVLLNSFALTYRLAEIRSQAQNGRGKLLGEDIPSRASEIAKLVCLRCEFPLFAADLSLDQRLPAVVLALAETPPGEPPRNVHSDVIERAQAYANRELPVGELLASDSIVDEAVKALAPLLQRFAFDDRRIAADETASSSGDDRSADPDGVAADFAAQVQREYAGQLLRYLRKTSQVPGPGSDLIYLESAGATFGLEPAVADALERDAIDGAIEDVVRTVQSLEPDMQTRGIALLAALVRDAPVGVDGQNAVSTLLETISRVDSPIDGIADDIANAVSGHAARVSLRTEDLAGAMKLALSGSRASCVSLREAVLRHPEALITPEVAFAIVGGAKRIPKSRGDVLGEAGTTAFEASPQLLGDVLARTESQEAVRILNHMPGPLMNRMTDPQAEEPEGITEAELERGLEAVLDAVLASGSTDIGRAAFVLALAIQHPLATDVVEARLGNISGVSDDRMTRLMLGALVSRRSTHWDRWLALLDPSVVESIEAGKTALSQPAVELWERYLRADGEQELESNRSALDALKRVVPSDWSATRAQPLFAEVEKLLAGPFSSEPTIQAQYDALDHASEFVAAGLLDDEDVSTLDLRCCTQTLGLVIQPSETVFATTAIAPVLIDRARKAIKYATGEALDEFRAAAGNSAWLSDADRACLLMVEAAEARTRDDEVESPYSAEELAQLRQAAGSELDDVVVLWLQAFAPTPNEVWEATGALAVERLSEELAEGLRARTRTFSDLQRFELVKPALHDALDRPPDLSFLRAVRFTQADGRSVGDELVALYGKASEVHQFEAVLSLWQAFKSISAALRRRLIADIYVPLIERGREGVDLALDYFSLVAMVRAGNRTAVLEALQRHAADNDQRERVERVLRDAGWTGRRGGLLRVFGVGRDD